MSFDEERMQRFQFSIRGLIIFSAAICFSLAMIRIGLSGEAGPVPIHAMGILCFGGTLGAGLGYLIFRSDNAGACGFMYGAFGALIVNKWV